MPAIDTIRHALTFTHQGLTMLVSDMRDAALVQPTPGFGNGGNHTLWNLGHLAFIESMMPRIILGPAEQPSQYLHWAPLFAPGTTPSADASKYPSFDEVASVYARMREQTLDLLDRVGESRLNDAPLDPPAAFKDAMSTNANTFLLVALHAMVHYGQITDARRVAGKPPLM